MSETVAKPEPKFAVFVALDWGDREHAWALEVAGSGEREHGKLEQTPEAIDAWAAELAVRWEGRLIAVGLEQARGALIYALQKYAHLVLYPIHPSTSSSYRAAIFPSGGKDDPVDADLLLDLVTRHRDRLRRLQLDTEETRKLQMLTEKRRQLVDEQTAQSNRVKNLLKTYYPQVLNWIDEVSSPLAVAFLQRWPTLPRLQQEDPEVVRRFFYQHGSRSAQRIEMRLASIRQARPAIEDRAIVDPSVLMLHALLSLLTALRQGIAELQRASEAVYAAHPDAEIFASFPGAGKVLAPRLLAAFGSQRDRWGRVEEFQPYTGIPPVTVRSGQSEWIHFRWACPKYLRQTFHEYAAHSIPHCEWASAFYKHQREVNKLDHHAAVRSLAYKWQRILFRCWKNRTPYQESFHQERFLCRQRIAAPTPSSRPIHQSRQPTRTIKTVSNRVSFQFKKVAGFWKLSDATS
jgi:transposase